MGSSHHLLVSPLQGEVLSSKKRKRALLLFIIQFSALFPSRWWDHFSGLSCGNKITSRMEVELVKSITSRSIPIPSPPAGGIPYSRAQRKSSSTVLSVPITYFCFVRRSRCSNGSFKSENAFATSSCPTKSSKRSTKS